MGSTVGSGRFPAVEADPSLSQQLWATKALINAESAAVAVVKQSLDNAGSRCHVDISGSTTTTAALYYDALVNDNVDGSTMAQSIAHNNGLHNIRDSVESNAVAPKWELPTDAQDELLQKSNQQKVERALRLYRENSLRKQQQEEEEQQEQDQLEDQQHRAQRARKLQLQRQLQRQAQKDNQQHEQNVRQLTQELPDLATAVKEYQQKMQLQEAVLQHEVDELEQQVNAQQQVAALMVQHVVDMSVQKMRSSIRYTRRSNDGDNNNNIDQFDMNASDLCAATSLQDPTSELVERMIQQELQQLEMEHNALVQQLEQAEENKRRTVEHTRNESNVKINAAQQQLHQHYNKEFNNIIGGLTQTFKREVHSTDLLELKLGLLQQENLQLHEEHRKYADTLGHTMQDMCVVEEKARKKVQGMRRRVESLWNQHDTPWSQRIECFQSLERVLPWNREVGELYKTKLDLLHTQVSLVEAAQQREQVRRELEVIGRYVRHPALLQRKVVLQELRSIGVVLRGRGTEHYALINWEQQLRKHWKTASARLQSINKQLRRDTVAFEETWGFSWVFTGSGHSAQQQQSYLDVIDDQREVDEQPMPERAKGQASVLHRRDPLINM